MKKISRLEEECLKDLAITYYKEKPHSIVSYINGLMIVARRTHPHQLEFLKELKDQYDKPEKKKLGSNYSIYLKAVEYLPSPDGKSFGSHKRYALLATKKYVTADRLKEILEECGFFKRKEKQNKIL